MSKSKGNVLGMVGLGLGLLTAGAVSVALARQFRKMDLRYQTVLLMGGSRGLALEIARILGEQGATVALAARSADELERARAILNFPADRLFTFECDVTSEEQVINTVARVQERCGDIDVLMNIAGVIQAGPFELQNNGDYTKSIDTHFWGPLYSVNAVLPSMRKRQRGRIVNISSIAGLVSVPHLLPYSVGKHALVGLSEGLSSELAKENIFVTTVCPGLMRTGSPRNAEMKGHNKVEYALFSIFDSLPVTSIDAACAARQIVEACKYGDSHLVISVQAKALKFLHSMAPTAVVSLFGMINSFLPGQGGIGAATAKGEENESSWAPSILTEMSDKAAVRNNEM